MREEATLMRSSSRTAVMLPTGRLDLLTRLGVGGGAMVVGSLFIEHVSHYS